MQDREKEVKDFTLTIFQALVCAMNQKNEQDVQDRLRLQDREKEIKDVILTIFRYSLA